ncbi:MAG: segregation/condensation protein A [candidate division WOR-3 bacterium]|nr:segregation/condensation protein A [candidate division WOR-3 bacterium]
MDNLNNSEDSPIQQEPIQLKETEYHIQTETFSGPIELLLYLIRKDEIDIFDIPIAKITDDYLGYLRQTEKLNLELSSDFLLMAVVLIRLKVQQMLPKVQEPEEIPQPISLETVLAEFQKYAGIASFLSSLESKRLESFPRKGPPLEVLPEAGGDIYLLISAFQNVLSKIRPKPTLEIQPIEIRLEDKITELRQIFIHKQKLFFSEIALKAQTISEIVILFIAILELVRLGELRVKQSVEFAEIELERRIPLDISQ